MVESDEHVALAQRLRDGSVVGVRVPIFSFLIQRALRALRLPPSPPSLDELRLAQRRGRREGPFVVLGDALDGGGLGARGGHEPPGAFGVGAILHPPLRLVIVRVALVRERLRRAHRRPAGFERFRRVKGVRLPSHLLFLRPRARLVRQGVHRAVERPPDRVARRAGAPGNLDLFARRSIRFAGQSARGLVRLLDRFVLSLTDRDAGRVGASFLPRGGVYASPWELLVFVFLFLFPFFSSFSASDFFSFVLFSQMFLIVC